MRQEIFFPIQFIPYNIVIPPTKSSLCHCHLFNMSYFTYAGVKPKEEPGVQINTMQEDLSKLLNVIPSTMQIPSDWYSDSGEVSNGQSSGVTDENIGIDMQHIASLFPLGATTDHSHSRTTGSCSWDNLPGIC